jgi:hypothetical protein
VTSTSARETSRVEALGGTFALHSPAGRGTTIWCVFFDDGWATSPTQSMTGLHLTHAPAVAVSWLGSGCVIAHTLRSTHLPTVLRSDEVMTVLQLVGEVRTMTDAEQWLVVVAVALLVVAFTGYVGLAVVLVGRTIVSMGRRAAAWPRYGSRRVTIKMPDGDPLPSRH